MDHSIEIYECDVLSILVEIKHPSLDTNEATLDLKGGLGSLSNQGIVDI